MRLWDDLCVPVYCKCKDEDHPCANPESFNRGGGGAMFFFFVDEGRESMYHFKRAIIGPPVKRHLNGGSLAGR